MFTFKKKKEYIHFPNPKFHNDGLATYHNCDFINEPLFKESYSLGKATGSWGEGEPLWRCHVCCWAAQQVLNYSGDFVECGVNKGGLSRAVMNYVNFKEQNDRKFWLFDTFNGIDKTLGSNNEKNNIDFYDNFYSECYEEVLKTFKEFNNVNVIKGSVPETLKKFTGEKIVYLSIDMNCLAPELAATEFFWDKLVSGGVIVFDDYGWAGHEEQKSGLDKFAQKVGSQILSLPTGQGLLIKA